MRIKRLLKNSSEMLLFVLIMLLALILSPILVFVWLFNQNNILSFLMFGTGLISGYGGKVDMLICGAVYSFSWDSLDIVDIKYYLSERGLLGKINSKFGSNNFNSIQPNSDGITPTLLARDYKDPKLIKVGSLKGEKWDKMHDVSRRVYSTIGISPTLHTCGGGNQEVKIIEYSLGESRGYSERKNDIILIDDLYKSREPHQYKNTIPTLRCGGGLKVAEPAIFSEKNQHYCIRKLTPKEYWRLMGFSDSDFDKVKQV